MRMWHKDLIPYMCIQHRVGVHGEIHKFYPSFVKHYSIKGRIGQIAPLEMKEYHDLYAATIKNHKSPYELPDLSYLSKEEIESKVDNKTDKQELIKRCEKCREIIRKNGKRI